MFNLEKRKTGMELLLNVLQRELCYPVKMMMELSRLKVVDSWFHMHIRLRREVLQGKRKISFHLNLERHELMSVVSHLDIVDIKQIHK
jgi:hypothetical protein